MTQLKKFKSTTVAVIVNEKKDKVWELWNNPDHIKKWYYATSDWHAPTVSNNLQISGKFKIRMESFDGKMGFDFEGVYENIVNQKLIEYALADGRKVRIEFDEKDHLTTVKETFDLENENPEEMQRQGWQTILNSFKRYAESIDKMVPLSFDISINATPEIVYKNLISDKSFREWTKVFNKDSHFTGSWNKGSKILFIGTDDKGNRGGMVSFIEENNPSRYISIVHRGIISGNDEIMEGPQVDAWTGAYERYTITDQNVGVNLKAYIDSNLEYKDYFSETYPKALKHLKVMCERV